jgi:gamma-glutamyltranspeptidase / glutathione hydrolase
MIATSQALASAAGLKTLQDGGNAIDAAVTAAGVLAVVEPSMNGIGGDLLAQVWRARRNRAFGVHGHAAGIRAARLHANAGRRTTRRRRARRR